MRTFLEPPLNRGRRVNLMEKVKGFSLAVVPTRPEERTEGNVKRSVSQRSTVGARIANEGGSVDMRGAKMKSPSPSFSWPSSSQTRVPSSEDGLEVRQRIHSEPEDTSEFIDLTSSNVEVNGKSDSEAEDYARGLRSTSMAFGDAIFFKEVRVTNKYAAKVTQLRYNSLSRNH